MDVKSARLEASPAEGFRRLLAACIFIVPAAVATGQSLWTRGTGWPDAKYPQTLTLDPQNPSRIWAGAVGGRPSGPGLGRSDDGGLSWTSIEGPDAPEDVQTVAINPENGSTIYTGFNLLRRSDDDGAHWASFTVPGESSGWFAEGAINALASDPHSPGRLWAATGAGLSRSEDGGQSWTNPAGLTNEVYRILFDGRRPGTMYASSYDHEYAASYYGQPYTARAGGPIYSSTDGGASWRNRADFGFPVLSFALDPFEDGVVYAGSLGAVHRSVDYGTTWETVSERFPWDWAFSIAVDPVRRNRLYAAAGWDVHRSLDAGRTWYRLAAGLPPGENRALAISPDGRRLYVASQGGNPVTEPGGVYWIDLEGLEPPYACSPGPERLCLAGGRYAVELVAGQPRASDQLATARPLNDRSGYFSLPFLTGDPELPEVLVKMLPEGTFGPGAPIFYTSLTTLAFVLRVTDTATGATRDYRSDWEAPLCGGADIAFREPSAPAMAPLAAMDAGMTPLVASGSSDEAALQLLGDRFQVTLTARDPRTGRTATGHPVPKNDRFGYFSFPEVTGDAEFPEVFVKMIDFRSLTGGFVLFHAGLTGFDYVLTMTDHETGSASTHENSANFCGSVDTISP